MKKILAVFATLALAVAAHAAPALSGAMAPAPSGNGYSETMTWTQAAACGTVVNGSTAACTGNVYSCSGTCTVASTSNGCTSTTSTWNKIASSQAAGGPYTDSSPLGGSVSYCVTNVATGGGWTAQESLPSNVFTQTFPLQGPTGLAGSHN